MSSSVVVSENVTQCLRLGELISRELVGAKQALAPETIKPERVKAGQQSIIQGRK